MQKKTELNQYTLANIPVNSQNNYTVGAPYKNFRNNGYSLFVLSRDFFRQQGY